MSKTTQYTNSLPTPALKWVGGKQRLSTSILQFFPHNFNDYWEPFVGSCAIAINVLHTYRVAIKVRELNTKPSLFLSDLNEPLIKFYTSLRDETSKIIDDINSITIFFNSLSLAEQKTQYYEYRRIYNTQYNPSLFYFLNKTSFNGVMRYNASGAYNVPFGNRSMPSDILHLQKFAEFLHHSHITCQDFTAIQPKSGDLVYLDPPYDPLTKTSNYTAYNVGGWNSSHTEQLKDFCDNLHKNGIFFILSNNKTENILNMFGSYNISTISATRSVGASSNTRKKVDELVITNF